MNIAELCSSLIKIRSENPPGNTVEIIDFIKDFLDAMGVQNEIIKGNEDRVNLVSLSDNNQLLFCGHVDVVPALPDGWTYAPYSGIEVDGYVWGRGTSDMKGGIASILYAIQSLVNKGHEPRVNLLFVCDEETGGEFGIQYILSKNLVKPCDCLVAEPTPPLFPNIGQKGQCKIDLTFRGEPAHGSLYPGVGRSAIMEAFTLIRYLQELNTREYSVEGDLRDIIDRSAAVLEQVFSIKGLHKILKTVTFNPGIIEGGEKVNIVAQHCNLQVDLRIPWGCSVHSLVQDILAQSGNAFVVHDCSDPNYTPINAPIVTNLCNEIEQIFLEKPTPIVQWAASDAKYLRKIGCDVVEYGPGEITTLHGVNERVKIQDLEKTSLVYEKLITRYSNYLHV